MLEAAVPSPNTLPVEEPMLLLKEAPEPNDAAPPKAGELPKEGGLPNTGALPKPPVDTKKASQDALSGTRCSCLGHIFYDILYIFTNVEAYFLCWGPWKKSSAWTPV